MAPFGPSIMRTIDRGVSFVVAQNGGLQHAHGGGSRPGAHMTMSAGASSGDGPNVLW